jgi:hypothetical protein
LRLPAYSLGVHISTRLFVLAAFLLSAVPVHAQVSFGVVGGATFFEINASGDESANVLLTDKLEPVFGVVAEFEVNRSFQIAPEALLSVKGTRTDEPGDRVDVDLRYLEVPVLFRYRPAAPSGARWLHLVGGPYVAWLLSQKIEGAGLSTPIPDDVFGSFDLGWVFGVGIGGDHARVDFRYSGGFTNIDSDGAFADLIARDAGVKFRNRGFSLVGAILF